MISSVSWSDLAGFCCSSAADGPASISGAADGVYSSLGFDGASGETSKYRTRGRSKGMSTPKDRARSGPRLLGRPTSCDPPEATAGDLRYHRTEISAAAAQATRSACNRFKHYYTGALMLGRYTAGCREAGATWHQLELEDRAPRLPTIRRPAHLPLRRAIETQITGADHRRCCRSVPGLSAGVGRLQLAVPDHGGP